MEKKSIKLSSILLWAVLGLSLVHFTFLLLGLFGIITPACLERPTFNYVISFVLVAICLILYIILMVVEKKKKMVMPEWFKDIFYIGFYIFTNVYYYFGLYGTLVGLVVFYVYFAFILNILALSVFFNTQKSDNNVLSTTNTFTSLTTFSYAVTAGALIEVVITAFKLVLFKNSIFSTISMVIIDMCIIVLVSIIMAIIYGSSLSKKKKVINGCLIKFYK
ncbi:MAG: hypothetical protein IKC11_02225 [Clostridia bacterium]|nr:hypothetical protein [Clostridia bacterium]